MIKVTVGNNIQREYQLVEENSTLRSAFEAAGVDYSRHAVNLNGAPIGPNELDKTFAEHGITETCYLMAFVIMGIEG